jgi:NitT/TauT family transport system permease protein
MTKSAVWPSLVLAVILLTLWEIGVRLTLLDVFYVSSPTLIASRLVVWFSSSAIWWDIAVTLSEWILGFIASILLGLGMALVVTQFRMFENAVYPLLTFFNAVPRIALAPLFVLWFGIGIVSKLVLVVSLVSLIFFFNIVEAIHRIDPLFTFHVRMLGGSGLRIWQHVKLPAIGGAIAASLRLGVAYSIIGVIVGEMIASISGIGRRIAEADGHFDSTGILAAVAVLCVIALALDFVAATAHVKLTPWVAIERHRATESHDVREGGVQP